MPCRKHATKTCQSQEHASQPPAFPLPTEYRLPGSAFRCDALRRNRTHAQTLALSPCFGPPLHSFPHVPRLRMNLQYRAAQPEPAHTRHCETDRLRLRHPTFRHEHPTRMKDQASLLNRTTVPATSPEIPAGAKETELRPPWHCCRKGWISLRESPQHPPVLLAEYGSSKSSLQRDH